MNQQKISIQIKKSTTQHAGGMLIDSFSIGDVGIVFKVSIMQHGKRFVVRTSANPTHSMELLSITRAHQWADQKFQDHMKALVAALESAVKEEGKDGKP